VSAPAPAGPASAGPAVAGLDAALGKLAAVRGRPAVLLHGRIAPDTARLVALALRPGPADLVLTTTGGSPTEAARIAAVLAGADRLGVLVPVRARSAGTLLALGADELVLTAAAELGPLDPLVEPPGERAVSAADIRAFRAVAAGFGVPAGPELLGLLCQRVAPTALARLHRLDGLVRALATRQLARHRPDADIAGLVDRLVAGYPDHDYPIFRAEARELGLRVTDATPPEEAALLAVTTATEAVLAAADPPPLTLIHSEEAPS
jgi:hypothetical protein